MSFEDEYNALKAQRNRLDDSEYKLAFRNLALKYLSPTDSETARQRREVASLGFVVAQGDGMSHEKIMEILSSPETIRCLASEE